MILVFGGTTEGRMTVKVLDESGAAYWYSTRSDTQEIQPAHGYHITGAMEVCEMAAFCHEHGIRLIIDAAHPFAINLHRNIIDLAGQIGTPVIRYDRIYPPHEEDLIWCKEFIVYWLSRGSIPFPNCMITGTAMNAGSAF